MPQTISVNTSQISGGDNIIDRTDILTPIADLKLALENTLNGIQNTDTLLLNAIATPSNPVAGKKLFLDTLDNHVKAVDSAGTVVDLETSGGGGGGISSLTLAGTSGTPQALADGNTITIEAGEGIATTAGATDKVTVGININSLPILSGAVDSALDKLPIWDASASAHRFINPSALLTSSTKYAIVRDQRASGATGGSSSATSWNQRTIGTTGEYDPDGLVTIASNQLTLVSGGYLMLAYAIVRPNAATSLTSKLRLYNTTTASVVAVGSSYNHSATDAVNFSAWLFCSITSNGTDTLRFDSYSSSALASVGLGANASIPSTDEVFLEALFIKVS